MVLTWVVFFLFIIWIVILKDQNFSTSILTLPTKITSVLQHVH